MDKEAHSEHEGREPPFPTAPWVGAGRTPSVRALTRRPTRETQARQKKKKKTPLCMFGMIPILFYLTWNFVGLIHQHVKKSKLFIFGIMGNFYYLYAFIS